MNSKESIFIWQFVSCKHYHNCKLKTDTVALYYWRYPVPDFRLILEVCVLPYTLITFFYCVFFFFSYIQNSLLICIYNQFSKCARIKCWDYFQAETACKGAKDTLCIFRNYSRVRCDLWDLDLYLGTWCHSQLQFLSSLGLYDWGFNLMMCMFCLR